MAKRIFTIILIGMLMTLSYCGKDVTDSETEKHPNEQPNNPNNPDDPDNPDGPNDPDNPDNPDDPDNPDNPDNPDDPDNPDNPDDPNDEITSAPYKVGDKYNDGTNKGTVYYVEQDGYAGKIMTDHLGYATSYEHAKAIPQSQGEGWKLPTVEEWAEFTQDPEAFINNPGNFFLLKDELKSPTESFPSGQYMYYAYMDEDKGAYIIFDGRNCGWVECYVADSQGHDGSANICLTHDFGELGGGGSGNDPDDPDNPDNPDDPDNPDNPDDPDNPDNPDDPDNPDNPDDPDNPDNPDNPDDPDNPDNPDDPDNPDNPDDPDNPDNPDDPDNPDNPDDPDNPDNPDDPDNPDNPDDPDNPDNPDDPDNPNPDPDDPNPDPDDPNPDPDDPNPDPDDPNPNPDDPNPNPDDDDDNTGGGGGAGADKITHGPYEIGDWYNDGKNEGWVCVVYYDGYHGKILSGHIGTVHINDIENYKRSIPDDWYLPDSYEFMSAWHDANFPEGYDNDIYGWVSQILQNWFYRIHKDYEELVRDKFIVSSGSQLHPYITTYNSVVFYEEDGNFGYFIGSTLEGASSPISLPQVYNINLMHNF